MRKKSRQMRVSEDFHNGITGIQQDMKDELNIRLSTTDLTRILAKNSEDFGNFLKEKPKGKKPLILRFLK